jgi:hypothetical protein
MRRHTNGEAALQRRAASFTSHKGGGINPASTFTRSQKGFTFLSDTSMLLLPI